MGKVSCNTFTLSRIFFSVRIVQRGADHPTDMVSEIHKEGKPKMVKRVHKNPVPSVHVAGEGNDDDVKQMSKLGEDSGVGAEGTNGGGEEGVEKTKEGKEAEIGEKRQRPIGIPEKEAQPAEEEVEAETPEAKKVKKDLEPVKVGRQAKANAKAKIQISETTPAKKRGVGRPKKSKKETRAEVNEVPVETTDDVQAATVKPVN